MASNLTAELVQQALSGQGRAERHLIAALTPEIQSSVARMLRRWRSGPASGRALRQEIEDLVQEVFVELFAREGRVLRRWDPQRLSLEGYVSYIARIRTAQVLRSPRSPWRENPLPQEDLERTDRRASPEDLTLAGDEVRKIYLCVIAGFHAAEHHLFDLLIVQQALPAAVAGVVGKSVAAIYKWRSRLYAKARRCREEIARLSRTGAPQQREEVRKLR